ncbi:MAG: hypothetical protein RBS68_06000 [Anaerolineales bacterium]|jgi:hypothetical protein|nr:hypothetical protein [Anaerolineales bacterium]
MDYTEIELDKQLNKPVSELTRKFYRDILEAMERTNVHARTTLVEVQEMLVDIASIVASPWMHEQRGLKMRDPREIKISELVPVVRKAAIEAHIEMTRIREKYSGGEALTARNKLLEAIVERQERDIAAYKQALQNQEELVENLTRRLANAQGSQPGSQAKVDVLNLDEESLHNHYQDFVAQKNSDKGFYALIKICEAGNLLSPRLRQDMASQYGGDERGRGRDVTEIIEMLESYRLITREIFRESGRPGNPPEIIAPTHAGIFFYEQHTGKKYISPEYLKMHKSEGQVLLVMDAESLLRSAGYEIHQPHVMKLDDNTAQFLPDIAASKDGVMIYCEVERATPKQRQDPDAKWRNFRHYTNGQMYVFFKDKKSRQDSFRYAQDAMRHSGDTLYLCDITLAAQHLKEKGTIWTSIHKKQ